jgi:hypothetical protein
MTTHYELKLRRTAADWDAVENENPLAKQMRTAQRRAEQVIQGDTRACYLSGGAGVGKSFAISQAIDNAGCNVIRAMPKNVRELERFFELSNGKTPLVFEECDHLFRSPNSLNLLKIATDSAGSQSIQVYVPKVRGEEGGFKTIWLTPPIVFAFNGNLLNDKEWPKECLPHIDALRSREQPLYIHADRTAWWEYATYLALRKRMLTRTEVGRKDIPLSVKNNAIGWFAKTMWRQNEVSPRRLMKIANVFMADHAAKKRAHHSGRKHDHRALDEDLEQFLLPDSNDLPPPPEVPAIFVTPKVPVSPAEHVLRV